MKSTVVPFSSGSGIPPAGPQQLPRRRPAEEFLHAPHPPQPPANRLQPLHTIVVTSPSPAEGKTFTAVNLALAQYPTWPKARFLLGRFDLRRPIVHNLFQIDRAPGLSAISSPDSAPSRRPIRRVEGDELYFYPPVRP